MLLKIKHSLRLRLMLLLSTLTVSILLGVGFYSNYMSSSVLEDATRSELRQWTHLQSVRILSFLKSIENDIHFLASIPSIQGIIRATQHDDTDPVEGSTTETWKARLAEIFLHFVENEPQYMQVRYIGKEGHELVRINSDGTQVKVIPPDKLQNKADTDYFQQTAKISKHEIYVSALNLNQEHGKIEHPLKPVIRYATPIFDKENNTFEGIIVINIFGKFILELLEEKKDARIYLLNSDGYYLKNSFEPSKEWGFGLKKPETKFQQNFEKEFNMILSVEQAGILKTDNERFLAYYPITIHSSSTSKWFLIVDVDKRKVLNVVYEFQTGLIGFAVIILIMTSLLSFFFATKITKSITQVVETSHKISQGHFYEHVPVTSKDEMGQMSHIFNQLIDKIADVLKNVNQASHNVTDAANDLMTSSTQMVKSTYEVENWLALAALSSEHITFNVRTMGVAIEEASANVTSVTASVHQLSSNINTIAAGAEQASTNLTGINHSFDKISQDINTVAQAVENVSSSLVSIAKNAQEAMKISNDANTSAQETLNTMSQLGETAKKIGRVVKLIDSIAGQTNMLALNATIEAASAGEAGKGFAVVAGEIKELAQQTAEANNDIAEQIEQIQEYAAEALTNTHTVNIVISQVAEINQAIETSVDKQSIAAKQIDQSVEGIASASKESVLNLQEAVRGLKEITQSTAEASQAARESAHALEEVSTGVKEVTHSSAEASENAKKVNKNIQTARTTMANMTAEVNHTSDSATQLANIAATLKQLVSFFKLNKPQVNENISAASHLTAEDATPALTMAKPIQEIGSPLALPSAKEPTEPKLLIEWNDNLYSVGIQEIDRQHKMLVELINQLHNSAIHNVSIETVAEVLNHLADYTVFHFDYEEQLLESHGWPEIADHKKIHKIFTNRIFDYQVKLKESRDTSTIGQEALQFLKDWLMSHIMKIDREYGPFLNARGIN